MEFIKQIFGQSIIEILAVLTGFAYMYFSVNRKILLWLFGIITSALYTYVYFSVQLYADMSLQVYYVIISLYGWYYWSAKGHNKEDSDFRVNHLTLKQIPAYLLATAVIYVLIVVTLIYTPELLDIKGADLPYWDAFTTAASIVATVMIARKVIENWLIFIVVDIISAGLYLYKGMYPTVILFVVYTIIAVIGYFEWKKQLTKNTVEQHA